MLSAKRLSERYSQLIIKHDDHRSICYEEAIYANQRAVNFALLKVLCIAGAQLNS